MTDETVSMVAELRRMGQFARAFVNAEEVATRLEAATTEIAEREAEVARLRETLSSLSDAIEEAVLERASVEGECEAEKDKASAYVANAQAEAEAIVQAATKAADELISNAAASVAPFEERVKAAKVELEEIAARKADIETAIADANAKLANTRTALRKLADQVG